jgi:hypothetical protein
MLLLLTSLLAAAPVSVHSDLPPELTDALRIAIERQTGTEPEITKHHETENAPNTVDHARIVRASTRANTVLIVRFNADAQRIDAQLIDRTGRPTQNFTVELARGKHQSTMSIDALARAAFPKLESPLASMLHLEQSEAPRAMKLGNAPAVAPGSFQLTVEVDTVIAGR